MEVCALAWGHGREKSIHMLIVVCNGDETRGVVVTSTISIDGIISPCGIGEMLESAIAAWLLANLNFRASVMESLRWQQDRMSIHSETSKSKDHKCAGRFESLLQSITRFTTDQAIPVAYNALQVL
jgi:hypothetical protein